MGRTADALPLLQPEKSNTSDVALWSTKATAQYLGVKEVTVRTWRRTGQGPVFLRVGGRVVRYRPEDVRSWLAEREAKSTSTPKVVNQ